MIYTIEKANLISEQLRRFTHSYAHYVAAQFANIDFWLHEVQESLKTIDEYYKRFNNIREAQEKWVASHGTIVFDYCPICGGKCELSDGRIPSPPVRVSSSELKATRKELVDSTYFFLLRCYRMRLLNDTTLETKCEEIGISIDPLDLGK